MTKKSKKINLVIPGAQKAASSFLLEALSAHTDVHLYPIESEAFESPFYESGCLEVLLNDLAYSNQKYIGIKRPDYLLKSEVPERILKHNPETRFIIILRNPISRFLSAIYWYMQVGIIPVKDPNIIANSIFEGLLTSTPKSDELLEYGLYHKGLSRYLEAFPSSNFYITTDDKLRVDQKTEMKNICNFLQIPVEPAVVNYAKKTKASIYNPTRLRLLAFANKHFFFKWCISESGDKYMKVRSKIFRSMFYILKLLDKLLSIVLSNKKIPLNESNLQRLKNFYAEDISKLDKLLPDLNIDWEN